MQYSLFSDELSATMFWLFSRGGSVILIQLMKYNIYYVDMLHFIIYFSFWVNLIDH